MSRPDLNKWHLLARGGIISKESLNSDLLIQPNKNGWLPVHLAKNKSTAAWLYELTLKSGIDLEQIVTPALINNAQSIQTKYGQDLMTFLMEQHFSPAEAKTASLSPNTQSRIDLSLFWLELANLESFLTMKEKNPIEIAICYSNSYFFMALQKLTTDTPSLKPLLYLLISSCPYNIGEHYLISDRAFQLQQILKQVFNIDKKINQNTINGFNKESDNAINNLEGF
jgi:hypothetical protein